MVSYSSDHTPTDKMDKNLSFLQKLSDLSQLSKEERRRANGLVKNLLDSMLLDKNMSRDIMSKNLDVLEKLAGKGLNTAKDAIEKIKTQQEKGNTATFSRPEAQSHGTLKETLAELSPKNEGPNGQEAPALGSQRPISKEALVPPPSEMTAFMDKRYGKGNRKTEKIIPPNQHGGYGK